MLTRFKHTAKMIVQTVGHGHSCGISVLGRQDGVKYGHRIIVAQHMDGHCTNVYMIESLQGPIGGHSDLDTI